ncbi:MAG: hypothetical protein VYB65_09935 [Myxococcota bacterium]|nr:hypothetical protein [Myxococcota bacterium]
MSRFALITLFACLGCSPLLNFDPDDDGNKTNPCEPTQADRGAADCALGFWCNPETARCERGDVYLPVYKTMPPSYAGTCFESDVSSCFDGRGACTIKWREFKDDQVEVRAGNLYEVKWENGAACYYLSLLFAGTWDWPDVFERSWCVNSDPLGNQLCVSNEISSITANTQAEYCVGTHSEGPNRSFEFAPRGTLLNNHCNWRLRCPDGDDTENWASSPAPQPQWSRGDDNARIAFFKETISNHCEVAQNTPLEDWPKDGNVVPKIPIAESDGFPGDIQLGDDANITWSGLAVPADGVSEVVRIERLTLKRTDSVREMIDGALELSLVHSGGNTTGNVRGMLARKDKLVLHLGGAMWRGNSCSPKLILDLEGYRASGGARIPAVIEGCNLDSTLYLCPGVRQDCRAD